MHTHLGELFVDKVEKTVDVRVWKPALATCGCVRCAWVRGCVGVCVCVCMRACVFACAATATTTTATTTTNATDAAVRTRDGHRVRPSQVRGTLRARGGARTKVEASPGQSHQNC